MKNLKRYVICFIFIVSLINTNMYAQKEANNWVFGHLGLDFNSDTVAVRLNYVAPNGKGMGVISDKNGQLLCYTDAFSIWNRNHSIMHNGADIIAKTGNVNVRTSAIIPKPKSNDIYYIFSTQPYSSQNSGGLFYSIVDMSKEDGLGDVILKGVKIQDSTDNKLTAVYHKNGHDVWVITHQYNSNKFHAQLLTENGLSTTAVVSTLGKVFASTTMGQLKASPDGTKVACSYNISSTGEGFSLYNFDNSTGELSQPLSFSLPLMYRGAEGLEFSPDAKKIFVYQTGSTGEAGLYQFDISKHSHSDINSSITKVFQDVDNLVGALQLAPDGKIYFTKGGGQMSGGAYLGVIHNPNERGANCQVIEKGLYLEGRTIIGDKTPTFIQNYFFKTNFDHKHTCSQKPTEFRISNEIGLDSVRWHFGQGSTSNDFQPSCTYMLPGEYTVRLEAYYPTKTDTITKTITIDPSPLLDLGGDRTVCHGAELWATEGFKSYKWNNGENTRSIIIKNSGTYTLTVENEFGCFTTDSVNLNIASIPIVNIPDSIELGNSDSIIINAGEYASYLWSTGETSASIVVKEKGWYSVTVANAYSCSATKSFYVYTNKSLSTNTEEWTLLNPQPSAKEALDICFLNSQVGYILNSSQILSSIDGGKKWSIIMDVNNAKQMAFRDNYGYIIGHQGIVYKSTYMGYGWNKLDTVFGEQLIGLSVVSKDSVFITSANKLYSSFDGGATWTSKHITNNQISSSFFYNSKIGHVGCSNGNVYKTTDGGNTWQLKSSINSSSSMINKIYFVSAEVGFISRGYTADILKTTDGGETWKWNPQTSDEIFSFFFLDTENGYIAGKHGAIHKTSNGGANWEWAGFQNGRYADTDIKGIHFIDKMTGFAVGLGGRIIKTTNGGKTWESYSPTYNSIRKIEFKSDVVAYGLVGNSIFKTIDGGNTWLNMGAPMPNANTHLFNFANENIGYVIVGGYTNTTSPLTKVYKTIDGGKTWTPTNANKDISYDNLTTIAFIDEKIGIVSVGNSSSGTYRTINGGDTWEKINNLQFSEISFIDSQLAYATTSNKLYQTTDGGITWNVLNSPQFSWGIKSFHFCNEKTGYILGRSSAEVFKTIDGANSWEKLNVPYRTYVNLVFHTSNIGFITDDYGNTLQTNDGGVSWTQLNKPYAVANLLLHGDNIIAYGYGGVIMKRKLEYQKAVLVAKPASNITFNAANITGTVTSNDVHIKDINFEYGINSFTDVVNFGVDSILPYESISRTVRLANLTPNQTYNYRVTTSVDGKKYTSATLQFTTIVEYNLYSVAVQHLGSNDAMLTSYVVANSNDLSDIEIQYGPDTTFTHNVQTKPSQVLAGNAQYINAYINDLQEQTRYYTRLKAKLGEKTVYSNISGFITSKPYEIFSFNPTINGKNAKIDFNIKAYKDTIRKIVLEYGTDRNYANSLPISGQVNKWTNNFFDAEISGLDTTVVYFYRIRATLGEETIYGSEKILKFKNDIVFVPIEHIQLSDSSIMLRALLYGDYLSNIKLQYGLNENYSDSVICSPNFIYGNTTYDIAATLKNLQPSVKYHARLTAWRGASRYYSDPFVFMYKVQSLFDINDIQIYPNPTTEVFTINSNERIERIEILNSHGELCHIINSENTCNVSHLKPGIYLVRFFKGNQTATRKLFKY